MGKDTLEKAIRNNLPLPDAEGGGKKVLHPTLHAPAHVSVVQLERVDDESWLALRQRLPQLLRVHVLQDLVRQQRLRGAVDLHHDGPGQQTSTRSSPPLPRQKNNDFSFTAHLELVALRNLNSLICSLSAESMAHTGTDMMMMGGSTCLSRFFSLFSPYILVKVYRKGLGEGEVRR